MARRIIPDCIREVLSYDPETGDLTWTDKAFRFQGQVAGHVDAQYGYRIIGYKGATYKAHRICWFLHHGNQPHLLDHINHCRDDNRIANLRSTSQSENMMNKSKPPARVTWVWAKAPHNRYFINAKYRGRHLYKGNDILKAYFRVIMAERADHPIALPKL